MVGQFSSMPLCATSTTCLPTSQLYLTFLYPWDFPKTSFKHWLLWNQKPFIPVKWKPAENNNHFRASTAWNKKPKEKLETTTKASRDEDTPVTTIAFKCISELIVNKPRFKKVHNSYCSAQKMKALNSNHFFIEILPTDVRTRLGTLERLRDGLLKWHSHCFRRYP